MTMTRFAPLFLAGSLAACSGSAFTTNGGTGGSVSGTGGHPNSGGSINAGGTVSSGGAVGVGGASSGGGSINAGGSIGAGGGTADVCESLWTDYLAKLEAARACTLDAGQCSIDSTLPNRCGCPVLVNMTTSADAKAAYEALTTNGCVQLICGIACVAYTTAQCSSDGSGSRSVCSGG